MYLETINSFIDIAQSKLDLFKKSKIKYFLLAMMAGVYIGFGIMLIFSIGAPFAAIGSPAYKLLMGISFGVALTLVIFAGSELFTSSTMVMAIGSFSKKISWKDTINLWLWVYLGNLAGSLLFAFLISKSGLISIEPQAGFIKSVVASKMAAPIMQLFIRGIFCNMLVCLAVWMAARTKEDTAKLILIFWTLFAFISSGFEHSVANMSLFGFALFIPHDPALISWLGFTRNLMVVTLGNLVGGAIFIGAVYYYTSSSVATGIYAQNKATINK